jgi:type III restriction enzyme
LIVEVTGFAKDKELKRYFVQNRWLPAVNAMAQKHGGTWGTLSWHFVELTDDERFKNHLVEAMQGISAQLDAQAESDDQGFWMRLQASTVSSVWADDDDQIFSAD